MTIVRVALILCVATAAACGGKKKQEPPAAQEGHVVGSGQLAPVLQPTQNKLDNAMDKEDKRATPDPETSGITGPGN